MATKVELRNVSSNTNMSEADRIELQRLIDVERELSRIARVQKEKVEEIMTQVKKATQWKQ